MKTVRGVCIRDFVMKFGSNDKYISYLAAQKWGEGFNCIESKSSFNFENNSSVTCFSKKKEQIFFSLLCVLNIIYTFRFE